MYAITANPHDRGYDIVQPTDRPSSRGNTILGRVGWDEDPGTDAAGLVLRIYGVEETFLPDTAEEAAEIVKDKTGRTLTAEAIADIRSLCP